MQAEGAYISGLALGEWLVRMQVQIQNAVEAWLSIGVNLTGATYITSLGSEATSGNGGFTGVQMTGVLRINAFDNRVMPTLNVNGSQAGSLRVPIDISLVKL